MSQFHNHKSVRGSPLNMVKRATKNIQIVLQNELNSDVARLYHPRKKHLATLFVRRQVRTPVVNLATSLFNQFCSHVAEQVTLFCCPFYCSFKSLQRPRYRRIFLPFYTLQLVNAYPLIYLNTSP